MQKIPTLFLRDENDRAHVTLELNPECAWVIADEGIATRKYDGTCVKSDTSHRWWARREVKKDGVAPPNYVAENFDPVTGKTQGWEPIEQSSFKKFFDEAYKKDYNEYFSPGTYELVGPKINGNPEGLYSHHLFKHADAFAISGLPLKDYRALQFFISQLPYLWEGIVWHHTDGRMAKLKRKDILLKGD